MILIKIRVVAHAVDFGGGRKDDTLIILDAIPHHTQVLFKIQLKHAKRVPRIFDGGGNGHQGNNDVAFSNMVFNPLPVDGNIPFVEMKVGGAHKTLNVLGMQVHAMHFIPPALQ